MRWVGSYRYATVNLRGRDREDLMRRYDAICANLSFEPARRRAPGNPLAALRP
jgi:hypothetical protein